MKYKIIKAFIITTFVSLNMIACDAKNVSNNSKTVNTEIKMQKIEKKVEVKKMNMEDLHKLQSEKKNEKDILIVDVRTAEEYEAGHIRYAINYSLDDISKDVSKLSEYKDKQVIVYCRSGRRSAQAAQILLESGFKNVSDAGGVNSYKYDLQKSFTNVSLQQFKQKANEKNVFIVDTRSKEEFAKWNVKNSVNIQLQKLDENLKNLPKDKSILIYSSNGYDGVEFAEKLAKKGYKSIYNLISNPSEKVLK